jgi:hypothetical protein
LSGYLGNCRHALWAKNKRKEEFYEKTPKKVLWPARFGKYLAGIRNGSAPTGGSIKTATAGKGKEVLQML